MAFGKEIKRLKEKERISAQKLAGILGVDEDRLRKWMEKDFNPRDEDARTIEERFGMSLDEICKLERLPKFLFVPRETSDHSYLNHRRNLKNTNTNTIMFYEVGATAGPVADILPVAKSEGVLHISDLFRQSQFAIRVFGNSMTPNYPPGSIIGIREVEDKLITPGSVYVIEKGNELWIKRLFYKNDLQILSTAE